MGGMGVAEMHRERLSCVALEQDAFPLTPLTGTTVSMQRPLLTWPNPHSF